MEVHAAVCMELQVLADARGADSRQEEVRCADGVPEPPAAIYGRPCKHCKRTGHQANICPLMVARERKEEQKCLQAYDRIGQRCQVCGGTDHEAKHHQIAVSQYAANSRTQVQNDPSDAAKGANRKAGAKEEVQEMQGGKKGGKNGGGGKPNGQTQASKAGATETSDTKLCQ